MIPVLAQHGMDWSIGGIAIFIIVMIVIIGIVLIVLRNSGVTLPQWFWHILGLVALGIVAILAIKFLLFA